MARRRYSDADKARTLAALDANGGNLKRTARECGVPPQTLAGWARGRGVGPAVADLRPQKKADLLALLEDLARTLGGDLADPGRRAAATLQQTGVALGIVCDKARDLRGEALERRVAALEAARDGRAAGPAGGGAGARPAD